MTAVASEGVPGTRHPLRQRLRSTVLGPHGGGTTRRRASDAVRLGRAVVVGAVVGGVWGGAARPVDAVSSGALGWGVAASLHRAVGSPLGLPSAAEITEWITDLNVAVRDLTRSARQVWGVEQFTGRDQAGNAIELAVYGRDASDARILAKLRRLCLYRDSGPTLVLDRLQQAEPEAYLTLMAGRAGALVPDVLPA